jgi:alpha-L-fucosidase
MAATGVSISLPEKAPDTIASVICLEIKNMKDLKSKNKIRKITSIICASLVLGGLLSRVCRAEESTETKEQRDARMGWWREAKFGMFIHWGVYAVPAGFYQGKPVAGIGEWIMNRGKIPMAEYQTYAKEFNPTNFNADAWVKAAKDAGMNYIVITSKHHDGFAMFDTKASPWNIMQASPYGKDPLKELAVACRKYGIKLGFYYSQAQDWNNGGSAAGGKWDPAQEHDMDDYIDKVAVPQVKEILSHYGEFPAVLWWDTPVNMNTNRARKLYAAVQALKPHIILNNRLGGGYKGDTETPEQFIPASGFPGRDWETCMTMNGTWGFKSDDHNWKSTETIIRNLCDIASKGGNYLLNVGPTSTGLIPQPSLERLAQVGAWMKVNGKPSMALARPLSGGSWQIQRDGKR